MIISQLLITFVSKNDVIFMTALIISSERNDSLKDKITKRVTGKRVTVCRRHLAVCFMPLFPATKKR